MRIMFMGTPDFAVPALKSLISAGHDICAVVTRPDRPKGRGMKLAPPPVKELASERSIPVFQPKSIKGNELAGVLEKYRPELIAVVAYGKILPEYILDFPSHGCINLHASLLPRYRGAAPIQHAVINGEKITGVSTMYMAEGLDTGDVILQLECPISDEDTSESMFIKLSGLGAGLLVDTVRAIESGSVTAVPQNDSLATYAPMIKKEDCRINWNRNANQVCNLIRGCYSMPCAFTFIGNKRVKVMRATPGAAHSDFPGKILKIDSDGMEVAAGGGITVIIKEMQVEGSKRMTPVEYTRGHDIPSGIILDDGQKEDL
ncbi:MAG: methionyl-tRNA formyltransferase [Clostridiales bacterium]|nr:methionyl-tRNA formyltransferase [Clostridiales bacterium]